MAMLSDHSKAGTGHYSIYLVITFLTGFVAAWIQKDFLTKPFTFCLPGHRKIPRKILFRIGGFISLLSALTWFRYPEGSMPILYISGVFMGAVFFLLGAYYILSTDRGFQFMGFIYLFIVMAVFLDIHLMLEKIIVEHPFLNFGTFLLVFYGVDRSLNKNSLSRNHCGKKFLGPGKSMNIQKARAFHKDFYFRKPNWKPSSFNEIIKEFAEKRMRQCPSMESGRYIWGTLYEKIGPVLVFQKLPVVIAMWTTIVLIFGYMSGGISRPGINNLLLIMPCIAGLSIQWPMYSTLLLPGGRRERYQAGVAHGVFIILIGTLCALIVISLGHIFELLLPTITVKGNTYSFIPAHPGNFFLPLLVTPIMLCVSLLLPRKLMIVYMVFFMAIFQGMGFWLPFVLNSGLLGIVTMILSAWAMMIGLIKWKSLRKNLT
jgi:hypothetical protein